MKRYFLLLFILGLLAPRLQGWSSQEGPQQKIRVVTTLPHLRWVAEQVGGERVVATSLANGNSDPHRILPTPSLMQEVAKADLFVEIGMSLELWAERVLDGARNAKVRRGAPGQVYAGRGVPVLQVPGEVTRAFGDVHPEGNPHIWLNPLNVLVEGKNIAAGLQRIDPEGASDYEKRLTELEQLIHEKLYGKELCELMTGRRLERYHRAGTLFDFLEKDFRGEKISARLGGWLGRAYPKRGLPLVVYHRMWPYLEEAFGVKVVAEIEEKPNIEPSVAHIETVVETAQQAGVEKVIRAPYYPRSRAESIAERIGAEVIVVPTEVDAMPECPDYPSLIDELLDRIL